MKIRNRPTIEEILMSNMRDAIYKFQEDSKEVGLNKDPILYMSPEISQKLKQLIYFKN